MSCAGEGFVIKYIRDEDTFAFNDLKKNEVNSTI